MFSSPDFYTLTCHLNWKSSLASRGLESDLGCELIPWFSIYKAERTDFRNWLQ